MTWWTVIAGWATAASALTAIMGFLVAAAGGLLALLTFMRSADDLASGHMHGLFRDYLKLRLDAESTARAGTNEVLTFKLYTLEEMLGWVRRQEARKFAPASRRSEIAGWRATVVSHLGEKPEATVKSLRQNASCYGDAFLLLAADTLDAPELAAWVKQGRPAQSLPLGSVASPHADEGTQETAVTQTDGEASQPRFKAASPADLPLDLNLAGATLITEQGVQMLVLSFGPATEAVNKRRKTPRLVRTLLEDTQDSIWAAFKVRVDLTSRYDDAAMTDLGKRTYLSLAAWVFEQCGSAK